MGAVAVGRVRSVVDPRLAQRLGQLGQRPEVGVVAGPLAGEHGVEGVVPLVGPGGVEPVAAGVRRRTKRGSLRSLSAISHSGRPSSAARAAHRVGQLLEDVAGRVVDEGVDGVEAQAVDVVVAQPHAGRCRR